jgi:hypothetical protein
MSHNWIFINSPYYRRFIERSRESRWVFWGATAGLFAVAVTAANVTMGLTNPGLDEEAGRDHSDQVSKLPMHTQVGEARAVRWRAEHRRCGRQAARQASRRPCARQGTADTATHNSPLRACRPSRAGTESSSAP